MSVELTVFVVDDDPSMLRALRRTIVSAGWRLQTFASGAAFLEVYNPAQRGCVVLDLRMPGMDGLAVQAQLAAQNASIPIIMITAFGDNTLAEQALQAGAVAFLEKPFSSQHLLACIESALARYDQTQCLSSSDKAI